MASRALVLDANILIRAVLGNRVRGILERYADSVSFFVPKYPMRKRKSIWQHSSPNAEATRLKG